MISFYMLVSYFLDKGGCRGVPVRKQAPERICHCNNATSFQSSILDLLTEKFKLSIFYEKMLTKEAFDFILGR